MTDCRLLRCFFQPDALLAHCTDGCADCRTDCVTWFVALTAGATFCDGGCIVRYAPTSNRCTDRGNDRPPTEVHGWDAETEIKEIFKVLRIFVCVECVECVRGVRA